MILRITGALIRAMLVALTIAAPALLLPQAQADNSQIFMLMAILAALLTLIEYSSNFPSIVEFRYAPPFNRLRFGMLFVTVILLTAIARGTVEPTQVTSQLTELAGLIGRALDVPFSPTRLSVLMLPADAPPATIEIMRSMAGLSQAIAVFTVFLFVFLMKFVGWPARGRVFNVWVNLPLFDPTAGGDVLQRLQRDARVNLSLGFVLPFILPAMVKAAALLFHPIAFNNAQTLIWTLTACAFIPVSMIMRGIALYRIAGMIATKRKRAYARDNSGSYQAA